MSRARPRTCRVRRTRVVVMALACVSIATGACNSTACPSGARAFVDGERVYCTFPSTVVIIGGFDCPPELPYGVAIDGGIVCTDQPTDRGDLPLEACGASCEPPEVRDPLGAGRWVPVPVGPERADGTCVGAEDGETLFAYGGTHITGAVSARIARPARLDASGWTDLPILPLDHPERTRSSLAVLDERIAVFGGDHDGGTVGDGAVFDPRRAAWMSMGEPRAPRTAASMLWTGTELLVFGGFTNVASGEATDELMAFEPTARAWTTLVAPGAPSPRAEHVALWTGRRLVIWGGRQHTTLLGDGAIYDPATGAWESMTAEGAPSPRAGACAGWTGEEVIVWGGGSTGGNPATGAAYNIATRRWRALSTDNAPPGRQDAGCAWTGRDLVIWGGQRGGVARDDGGAYDPLRDEWRATTLEGAPSARFGTCAARFGGGALFFGGGTAVSSFGDGAVWMRE